MAAPTPAKTWQVEPNMVAVQNGDEHDLARKLMQQFHEAVTGFSSNPWTVAASSDGSTAGAPGPAGSDGSGFTDYTDWSWSTGSHSWIVYNHPSGAQILFDQKYTSGNCEDNYVEASPGGNYSGFTSTSTAPTCTDPLDQGDVDGLVMLTNGGVNEPWWSGYATSGGFASVDLRHHVWHSSDGLVTWWVIYRANVCVAFWFFGDIADPRAGQTNPFAAGCMANGGTSTPLEVLAGTIQNGYAWIRTNIGGTNYSFGLYGLGSIWVDATYAAVAEETDSQLQVTEVTLVSGDSGARGNKGKLFDLWWTQDQVVNSGDTSPNNASARDFVHFGCYMFPWTGDSTVPLIS